MLIIKNTFGFESTDIFYPLPCGLVLNMSNTFPDCDIKR